MAISATVGIVGFRSLALAHTSAETAQLRFAKRRGTSLEALVRAILQQAAEGSVEPAGFPHDLVAIVEPGKDIEPFLRDHDEPQTSVDLP